jgi:predicted nucleotidyltransferase component of viral defense system
MEQEILKNWQRKVIDFLVSFSGFEKFYLTGGTALAGFYLRHRISDDLDFFSYGDIDSIFIHDLANKIKNFLGASEMRFSRLYDRYQFFYLIDNNEEIKIEFAKYPFLQVEPMKVFNGLSVDSERDIAINKLAAILDRFDPKDFVDLYFLLPKFPLSELRKGVEMKFGIKIDPLFLGSELSKARRIEALPKMIKPLTTGELKDFFSSEIKKISSEVI